MITSEKQQQQSWKQAEKGLHIWELIHRESSTVRATVWLDSPSQFWHWSVPGNIPKRGARRVFREAISEAQGAAGKS